MAVSPAAPYSGDRNQRILEAKKQNLINKSEISVSIDEESSFKK